MGQHPLTISSHALRSIKARAKARDIPFNISITDLELPPVCPVFGCAFTKDNPPSVDQLIPRLGYVIGNVRVISLRANQIKSNATPAELRQVADWIEKEFNNFENHSPP